MNFQRGSALAVFHESIFKKLESKERVSKRDIRTLKNNYWIKLAFWFAPSNLVVQHYCLLDLCTYESRYVDRIFLILSILTQGSYEKIWVEGYGYWGQIRKFLIRYGFLLHGLRNHKDVPLNRVIREIDIGFFSTAYRNNGLLYPIPIGDFCKEPIREINGYPKPDSNFFSNDGAEDYSVIIGSCRRRGSTYFIQESYVGFNLHTRNTNRNIQVDNGTLMEVCSEKKIPVKYYEGHEKKYPNTISILKDLLAIPRIISAIRNSFQSFFILAFYKTGILGLINRGN